MLLDNGIFYPQILVEGTLFNLRLIIKTYNYICVRNS